MPRSMMSDYSGMVCEIPPQCQFGSFEKKHRLDNGKTRPRRRCSTLDDDETLKYLTHEEKDVLLFFEETIDALEDDLEEQALHDSGIHCHSPRSMEENMSSQSESEDIIDLVQSVLESSIQDCDPGGNTEPAPEEAGKLDTPKPKYTVEDTSAETATPLPVLPSAPPLPIYEVFPAAPAVQHPKLVRCIPTPLVIAQKISEKQAEGTSFSPASPKEGRPVERRSTPLSFPLRNKEHFSAFKQTLPPPTAPKPQRFPSNISITNVGEREFSKTISRAAVSVQERKARVLANVNGSPYFISETEERLQKHDMSGHTRSSSVRDLPSEQARHEALSRLSLVDGNVGPAPPDQSPDLPGPAEKRPEHAQPMSNGYRNINDMLRKETSQFPSVSKTVTFRPDADLADGKLTRQNAAKSFCNHRLPDLSLEMRRRSGSLPRPSGLRPQGITVQFSGRGSTEEARREALRKLGLLKD